MVGRVSPKVKKIAIAEARFMRALAYRFLVMNWGAVPIIENNFDHLFDTSISRKYSYQCMEIYYTGNACSC